MSYWTRKRQLIYVIIILVILLLIVLFVAYKISHRAPTCFDGIWNGDEEGVDCGGSCARVCSAETLNIVNWWVRPFEASAGIYNIVASFENQNIDSGVREAQYEIRIYDNNNIPIGEPLVGSTFIEPNRRSAFMEIGFVSPNARPYTLFLDWDKGTEFEKTDALFYGNIFAVENDTLTNRGTSPRLSADIRNLTLENLNEVEVIAIVYNEKGNAMAASKTVIPRLDREEVVPVTFAWNTPFSEKIAKVEIIPRINPFTEN